MRRLTELQYQGLNLVDEVGTVEVAIDPEKQVIHVYDTQQIVAPEYDFKIKNYVLTDSFFKMASIIKQKNFLEQQEGLLTMEWVEKVTWIFYSITTNLKLYENGNMVIENINSLARKDHFYAKYVERIV